MYGVVTAYLSQFDEMNFIDEEYIEGKYGEILKIRFETKDDDGCPIMGTGYYWYESSPKICCLEVVSDAWRDGKAEEMIKDSICRVSSGSTAPYSVDDSAFDDNRKEEALNAIAEDAMREQYQEQEHDTYAPW